MKKYLLVLFLAAPGLAQAQDLTPFTLKGKIGKVDAPAKVFLLQNGGFERSATLHDGTFELQGLLDTPGQTMLLLVRSGNLNDAFSNTSVKRPERIFFFLEPGPVVFTSADSLQNASITGAKTTAKFQELQALLKPIYARQGALKLQPSATSEQKAANIREIQQQQLAFIKANPDSYVSLDLLKNMSGDIPRYAEVGPLYEGLSARIRNSGKGRQYGELLQVIQDASGNTATPDSARVASAVEQYQRAQQKKANEQRIQQLKAYIKANPSTFSSLEAVQKIGGPFPEYTAIAPLFASLSPALQNSPEGKKYSELLQQRKDVAIGAVAPNFTLSTPEGKAVALKSYRGKYVLVDFWASWCGPCRQENPNVAKAYNEYKTKNFDVLGVSLDAEKDRGKWLKAIQTDQLPWTQVSDLKGWDNQAAKLYHIQAIPQNFLVDPSGKIVATNLRGDELQAALDKYIK